MSYTLCFTYIEQSKGGSSGCSATRLVLLNVSVDSVVCMSCSATTAVPSNCIATNLKNETGFQHCDPARYLCPFR